MIAEALHAGCLAQVELTTAFDTDLLGTFTRDVPRPGSQFDAARAKARKGMSLRDLTLGLGSEGSLHLGPFGLSRETLEIVLLVDDERGIEIAGVARRPVCHVHATATNATELSEVARRADFPRHGLVLRPDREDGLPLRKGLREWGALEAAFAEARAISEKGAVFIETDMRAHMNPSRMEVIQAAARDLATRMSSLCRACGAPGFGVAAHQLGLPCRACELPTSQPRAARWACVKCTWVEERPLAGSGFADPGHCDNCNP